MKKFYTVEELNEMQAGRKLKGPKYVWTKNSDHTWSLNSGGDSFIANTIGGDFFEKPNELDPSPAIGARAVEHEHDLITVEDYVGVEGEIDFGALNIFRLSNSMRGKPLYEPVPAKTLEAAEVFAAELAFRVHAAGGL